jgi:hypothetical protein
MLYTLSVFVTSPDKWLGLYDWRGLTELEVSVMIPLLELTPLINDLLLVVVGGWNLLCVSVEYATYS